MIRLIFALFLLILTSCSSSKIIHTTVTRGDKVTIKETITKKMNAEQGQTLELELTTPSDVEVIGWNKDWISIKVHKKGPDHEDLEFTFARTASGLRIQGIDNETSWKKKGIRYLRADLEIRLPERFNLKIRLKSSGKACLSKMQGDITIQSRGKLKLEEVTGKIHMETSGGDIQGIKVAGNLKIETDSGDVKLTLIHGASHSAQEVDVRSGNGEVELFVPEEFPMEVAILLDYTKDQKKDYVIFSDFKIDIEKPSDWKRIPTGLVKWYEMDDRDTTVYGIWADKVHRQVIPLYKEWKSGTGTMGIFLEARKQDVEGVTPVEILQKTVRGTGTLLSGENRISVKTRNGNVYLKKIEIP